MRTWILNIILFVATIPAIAQVKFQTKLSSNQVRVGERLKVTYQLNTTGERFSAPAFKGFTLLSGPNQSTNMQWINGRTSHSISYSFILQAEKEGDFTIPGASIKVDGKTYTSQNVKVKVAKGSAASASTGAKNQKSAKQNDVRSGNEVKENLFLRVSTNKKKAYVGEPISVTYQIYTRVNIVNNGIHKLPSFNGFWAQEVDIPNNPQLRQTNVNGVPYNVATLKKTILFPQQTGKLKVDPLALDVVIRVRDNRRPRSVFDQFFGGYKDIKYRIESNEIAIEALPVPTKGRPLSFTGAVGNFKVSSSIDQDSVMANDAINYKITYSGTGNLKFIEKPLINFPPDFEVYDPKINERLKTTSSGVSGTKTYEYLIIPRHAGTFEIDPVEFSYFDPSKKKFITSSTPGYEIKVGKDGEEADAPSAFRPNPKKEDVKLLGQDIRYIKTGKTNLTEKTEEVKGKPLLFAGFAIPSLAFVLFLFFTRSQEKSKNEILSAKSKKAGKIAQQRLKKARKALDSSNQNEFYVELLSGLNTYFSDKLSIPMADLTKEQISNGFAKLQLNEELSSKALYLMDDCEMARYAPSASKSAEALLSEAELVIKEIEQHA